MNAVHRRICRSALWKKTVETKILPWALDGVALGSRVLEIGPGPGVTTDLLRTRVEYLTCVEIDPAFAESLSRRLDGRNVTVLNEDATTMSFPDASFDGAVSFTMLHHVPSAELQDRLLAEVARVLCPGATFAGTYSLYSRIFGLLHLFDTMVVIDPKSFPDRLRTAGFTNIHIDVGSGAFRFRATKAE
jgi:SAM-dependent methyltransferase